MDKIIFDKFRRLVYDKAGISLNEGKVTLVSARVGKRMRELGINNHSKYLAMLKDDVSGNELVHFLDAISTNVTHFFRESKHFDFLSEEIKNIVASGQNKIRIWCAASSSGEEPYSIAMTFMENKNGFRGDMRILATDISTKILKQAKEGVYSADKIGKIPPALVNRYFRKFNINGSEMYKIQNSIADYITFARLNLSVTPFPMSGPFDIVFCRNVMIYFDNNVRMRLLNEIIRLLKPGGYLIVGLAESLTGMLANLVSIGQSIYRKE